MHLDEVMRELEALGKERLKKMYISNGAREPLFGVATGEMKPLFRRIKLNQPLAEKLYATGNYDAMYFAGIIAEPDAMTEADYDRWMDGAYFYMLSDYVVAVTLSEAEIAREVADKWIASGEELRMSAGWSCYCWLLGSRPDDMFAQDKLSRMLEQTVSTIHDAPERTKHSMNNFLYTLATSYLPLHEAAVAAVKAAGPVHITDKTGTSKYLSAETNIQKMSERGKLGFKRKHVRC